MSKREELELLAEWLGIERWYWENGVMIVGDALNEKPWNPTPEGNDTDFLNMVAGRVDFRRKEFGIAAVADDPTVWEFCFYSDFNNDKLAAMKHAGYQVCLMAAKEWKEGNE